MIGPEKKRQCDVVRAKQHEKWGSCDDVIRIIKSKDIY
jgi:hypothetical protein